MDRKRLKQYLVDAEVIDISERLPEFEHMNKHSHAVAVDIGDGKQRIVQYCSPDYNLTLQKDIVLPFIDHLEANGLNVDLAPSSSMENSSRFFMDFTLSDHNLSVGKRIDQVIPKIRMVNSYDGRVRYAFTMGFFRLVCSNGLMIPEGDVVQIRKMHTPGLDEVTNFDAITDMAHDFIAQAKNAIGPYKQLAQQKVPSLEERVEEVMLNSRFPKRQQELVLERINQEISEYKIAQTDWAVYNGFNGELNHNQEIGMPEHKKTKLDQDILQHLLAYPA